ncbi:MAG: 4-hydroxythreonine-4-phosphate dehydrogenase PdxA [Bacteroidales bacterium]|nr:4-hydroxythreonine-4-phosphate dehydrogenase PdxA [Bacteroidales bacterium]
MDSIKAKIHDDRIKVGITHGDINGIGYEVIIKALEDVRMLELFTPIIYGHSRVASFHKKNVNVGEFNFNLVKDASQANPKRVNIINCTEQDLKIDLGISTAIAGEAALLALEMAMSDLKSGLIDVLVTAPINKQNIQSEEFGFPGHTEYLSSHFDNQEPLMLMVWNKLRVGTVTGHIPLAAVPSKISANLIRKKLQILNHSLITDFGIGKPKIAVLGLNPHAGDGGLLGQEENDVINPAIEKSKKEDGVLAFGPFPADGFFGASTWKKYDAVLAMYHDQGLTPFKSLAFDGGVNYTAGLPIVRTSPAHGTAYEIAGKNEASEEPFRQAIYLAIDVIRNRRLQEELLSNPLKIGNLQNS